MCSTIDVVMPTRRASKYKDVITGFKWHGNSQLYMTNLKKIYDSETITSIKQLLTIVENAETFMLTTQIRFVKLDVTSFVKYKTFTGDGNIGFQLKDADDYPQADNCLITIGNLRRHYFKLLDDVLSQFKLYDFQLSNLIISYI